MPAPTWAPWVEKENKSAQLQVTMSAARGNPGAQKVAANDGIGRAGEADSQGAPGMSLLRCCPGFAHFEL